MSVGTAKIPDDMLPLRYGIETDSAIMVHAAKRP
jgi:hypothetical protein